MTAVSPIAGWPRARESKVVLPEPRNPVRTETGRRRSATALRTGFERREQAWVERVEGLAVEPLRLLPHRAEVGHDRLPPLAVSQHVHAAAPVVELEPEMAEHRVEKPNAEEAGPPAASLLGPVVTEQGAAQAAHQMGCSTVRAPGSR